MRTLVTGASGFVGAHIVARLAQDSEVIAADLAPPPGPLAAAWAAGNVRFLSLDVADAGAVARVVAETRPARIVHAAAITPDLAEEARDMARIVAVNVGGTANVVDAALKAGGVGRLVLFSSSAVYNGFSVQPSRFTEDMILPPAPASLYAVTKFAVEGIANRAAAVGLSVAALRVASVYGEFERPTDSRRAQRMSLMHRLALATAAGTQVRCGESDAGRDWIHGDDVARAVSALLAAPRLSHLVYNVASGEAARWRGMVACFKRHGLPVTDDESAPEVAMRQEEDRPAIDIARIAADTGFAPSVSLEEGVSRLVAHHRGARAA